MIPNGFLATDGGTVNYADADQLTYSSLPTDGVHALTANGATIQNVATNFAGASASVVPTGPPPPPPTVVNYQGLWWKSPAESESGWGINLAHQGDVIFVTWFTYDLTGHAWWLSMIANKTAEGVYTGTIYQTHGPAFNAVPFDPATVVATQVGTGTLTFTDANNGTFAYTVNGGEPGQADHARGVRAAAHLHLRRAAEPRARHQLPGPLVRGAGGVRGRAGG